MSESTVSAYVANQPVVVSLENVKFNQTVEKVISMGFQPSTASTFMKAFRWNFCDGFIEMDTKMEFYRKCGWTEDDFLVAFRKNPMFIQLTEKNISRKMDFILNRMALVQPADLASNPTTLTYSLENRIIPRCSVIRVLLLKNLIRRREFSFTTMMRRNKQYFLDRFVVPYQQPELLSIFEGKMVLAVRI